MGALHILGLYQIAFAKPLLDVLGNSPLFFVAHHASAFDVVLVTLGLCLLLPLPLLLALQLLRWLSLGVWSWAQAGSMTLLAGLFVLVLGKETLPLPGLAPLLPAAALGLAYGLAYRRSAGVQSVKLASLPRAAPYSAACTYC